MALSLLVAAVLVVVMVVRTALGQATFSIPALVEAVRRRFALRLFVAFVTAGRGAGRRARRRGAADRHPAPAARGRGPGPRAGRRGPEGGRGLRVLPAAARPPGPVRSPTPPSCGWRASSGTTSTSSATAGSSPPASASSTPRACCPRASRARSSGRSSWKAALDPAHGAHRRLLEPRGLGARAARAAPSPAVLSMPLALRQRELRDDARRPRSDHPALPPLVFLVVAAALAHSMSRPHLRAHPGADRGHAADRRRRSRGPRGAPPAGTSSGGSWTPSTRWRGDLERQRRDLERSNRLAAWAEMARQVAHEVKNPLTPIQLSAEHLRRVFEDRSRRFRRRRSRPARTPS